MGSKYAHTRYGDDLLCIAVDDPRSAQALAAHLRSTQHWLEVVPGIDSVVVQFDAAGIDIDAAERRLEGSLRAEIAPLDVPGDTVEIPVVYGGDAGPDLDELCAQLGMSQDEFVDLHTGAEYRVDMVGFTPGFVFIGGLDARLHVPRRSEPRQRVAAGSIGIADGRTGIYALASPGGWTIVGRTTYPLFDAHADEPFPVRAGARIRFKAVTAP